MPAGRSGAGVTQTRFSNPSRAGRPSAWVSAWLTVKALPPHSLTWLAIVRRLPSRQALRKVAPVSSNGMPLTSKSRSISG